MLFIIKQDVALVYVYTATTAASIAVKRGPSKNKLLLSHKCQ